MDGTSAELVLSFFSMRAATFEERVAAAAGAGFAGIGLYVGAKRPVAAASTEPAYLRGVLADSGVALWELEALAGWGSHDPAVRMQARAAEDSLFALADALGGAHHVQAIGPFDGSLDDGAEAFAALCDRAADHGLAIALEFLPDTNVPDAAVALDLVERSGRPNGGLCVDSWHHERGARDLELLRRIPAGRVVGIQVDDGLVQPEDDDYRRDTMANRRVPGDGEFDLVGFVRTMRDVGADVPWSVEVLSTELDALPPAEAARRLAEGWRGVLAAASA